MRNIGFYALVLLAAAAGGVIGTRADFGVAHDVAEGAANRLRAIAGLFSSQPSGGLGGVAPLKPAFPAIRTDDEAPLPRRFTIDASQGRNTDNDSPLPPGFGGGSTVPTNCSLPRVDARSVLVVLGVYEGDAMSSVALADRDKETSVAELVIEPGDAPLHIVLVSYDNLIWRFSGAVDRVSRVVLIASPTHPPRNVVLPSPAGARRDIQRARPGRAVYAGTTGLPSDRVTTVAPDACTDYFHDPRSIKAARFAAVVGARAGRRPDVLAGVYSLSAIKLPSAMAAVAPRGGVPAPAGFDRALWRDAVRFNPSGLAQMQPEDVVSSVPVLAYDVLPSQVGLAQLAGDGRIVRLSDGLKIVKPIPRVPAGLNGAHSVTFLLGRGVPLPAGSPGHSCVIREADGAVAGNSPLCSRRW